MKRIIALMLAAPLLALLAGTALAETYVEGYVGQNFTITAPNPIGFDVNQNYKAVQAYPEYPQTLSPPPFNIIGGFKLGTWFSKEGFPHFDYPDWLKYFGCYLDFSYHSLNYYQEVGTRRINIYPSDSPFFDQYKFLGDGSIITLGFMFAARYGFLPTEKAPFGKIQPYLAVGPAIMITTLKPTYMVQPSHLLLFPYYGVVYASGSRTSTVSPGLQVELGVRFMLFRHLFFETSCKYRYTALATTYDINIDGFTHQLRYAPQFNMFSIYTGFGYHF